MDVKVSVDEDLCTACGLCVELCPDVFEIDDKTGLAKAKRSPVPVEAEPCCRGAAEQCPVEAIIVEDY